MKLKVRPRVRPDVVVLGSTNDGKATIVVSTDGTLDARILARAGAAVLGGSAGGTRSLAQGGGPYGDRAGSIASRGRGCC